MEIKILKKDEHEKYYEDISELLFAGDKEFVPPLSARSSAIQTDLKSTQKVDGGIISYLEEIKKQRIMVATENDRAIAFVAFREDFTNDKITIDELPDIYISTLIVSPANRGKGITQKMYESLFKEYEAVNIFTRTWSTNSAHIKILSKFGFKKLCVIENDRGEGIDTVYFKKSPESCLK